jgi:hypothetical protein
MLPASSARTAFAVQRGGRHVRTEPRRFERTRPVCPQVNTPWRQRRRRRRPNAGAARAGGSRCTGWRTRRRGRPCRCRACAAAAPGRSAWAAATSSCSTHHRVVLLDDLADELPSHTLGVEEVVLRVSEDERRGAFDDLHEVSWQAKGQAVEACTAAIRHRGQPSREGTPGGGAGQRQRHANDSRSLRVRGGSPCRARTHRVVPKIRRSDSLMRTSLMLASRRRM